MIKGEAHERFTDTFLFGLKNGFINASLKAVSRLPFLRHLTTDPPVVLSLACQFAYDSLRERLFTIC